MPTRTANKTQLTILRARHLDRMPWLVHGFSTRVGGYSRAYGRGELNLGYTKDDSRAAVERNRAEFLRKVGAVAGKRRGVKPGTRAGGAGLWPLITLRQIHSDIIHCIGPVGDSDIIHCIGPVGDAVNPGLQHPDLNNPDLNHKEPLSGDGMITATPGMLLGIQTADCLPVILVDTKRRVVGVFHAGWRGTVQRIVEKGVGEMQRCFGSRARDLKAAIGPGIQGCCYEVGEDVRTKFESQFGYGAKLFREVKDSDPVREKYPLLFMTARAPGHGELPPKIFLDLVEANRRQLLDAGVAARNIETSALCTNCHNDLLFSYRAEKGKTGRMMAVVGIRES